MSRDAACRPPWSDRAPARGAHVWFFFEEAIPAALARKLGSFLLTETMERRPEIGLDSYDRLFPNQDTLPQGGFGNLIALPLQKQAQGTRQQRLRRRLVRAARRSMGISVRVERLQPLAALERVVRGRRTRQVE